MGLETENPKLFLEEAKEALNSFQGIQENLGSPGKRKRSQAGI